MGLLLLIVIVVGVTLSLASLLQSMEGLALGLSLAGFVLVLASLLRAMDKAGFRYKRHATLYATGLLLLAVGGEVSEAAADDMFASMAAYGILPTIVALPFIRWARHRANIEQSRQARQKEQEAKREAERASAVVLYLAEAHNCASPFEEIMQTAETHLKDGNPYSFWETMESVGNLMIFSPDDKMLGEMKHYDSLGGYEGLKNSMKGRMRELFVRAMNIKDFADMHYQRETIASLKEVVAQLQQLVSVSREALAKTANAAASTAQMVNCMKGIAGDIESIKKRTGLTVATTLVTAGIAGYIAHNQNSPAAIVGEIWNQP